MSSCWQHSPDHRPSFADVVARLDRLLEDRTTEVTANLKFLIAYQTTAYWPLLPGWDSNPLNRCLSSLVSVA